MNALHEINEWRHRRYEAEQNKLWRPARQAHMQVTTLQRSLRDRFAELNGWQLTRRQFPLAVLRDNKLHGNPDLRFEGPVGFNHDTLDHAEYFRHTEKPYRAAAIVAHLYGAKTDELNAYAKERGLVAHIAPSKMASWYYPGGTTMVVYVRPGTGVTWLPEQRDVWWDATAEERLGDDPS